MSGLLAHLYCVERDNCDRQIGVVDWVGAQCFLIGGARVISTACSFHVVEGVRPINTDWWLCRVVVPQVR